MHAKQAIVDFFQMLPCLNYPYLKTTQFVIHIVQLLKVFLSASQVILVFMFLL